MGYSLFFIFKNVLFFTKGTEQNTKEIIHYEDVILS